VLQDDGIAAMLRKVQEEGTLVQAGASTWFKNVTENNNLGARVISEQECKSLIVQEETAFKSIEVMQTLLKMHGVTDYRQLAQVRNNVCETPYAQNIGLLAVFTSCLTVDIDDQVCIPLTLDIQVPLVFCRLVNSEISIADLQIPEEFKSAIVVEHTRLESYNQPPSAVVAPRPLMSNRPQPSIKIRRPAVVANTEANEDDSSEEEISDEVEEEETPTFNNFAAILAAFPDMEVVDDKSFLQNLVVDAPALIEPNKVAVLYPATNDLAQHWQVGTITEYRPRRINNPFTIRFDREEDCTFHQLLTDLYGRGMTSTYKKQWVILRPKQLNVVTAVSAPMSSQKRTAASTIANTATVTTSSLATPLRKSMRRQ
jgi:hypothetical protein